MKVEKEIDARLQDRNDLVQIMDAAATYLASRDTDTDSQARARWKLSSGANGETWIGLQLDDRGYSTARNFAPSQLVPADIREWRLVEIWNDVLSSRTRREFDRVNELIRQYRED